MQERLQKILARAGVASRRKAEELIEKGLVSVNGAVVRTLGSKADPAVDRIAVNGKLLAFPEPIIYLLNKPVDVITTRKDERGRMSVMEFVPKSPAVYPVGRLDRMTEGLLLLTNDGTLANQLMHPRFEHEKEYEVVGVSMQPVAEVLARLQDGAILADGPMKPDRVTLAGIRKDRLIVRIVMHQGRSHVIRRLCSILGFEIISLKRIRIGSLELGDLPVGKYRILTDTERTQLLTA